MKKIFTLFVALFVAFSFVNAQILSESFEGEVAGWSIYDGDGDGFNWSIQDFSAMDATTPDGTKAGWSESFSNQYGTALTPDNWLITPQISIPAGNATLTFYAWGVDASWAAEHLGIFVSAEEMPTDNTFPVDNFTQVFEQVTTGDQIQYTVDLSSYAGQNIYIAFRHYEITDMFVLALDLVEVTTGTTGIEDINVTANVYPNPASDVVNVNAAAQINDIELYNIAGQKVSTFNVNNTSAQINVAELANGIYFLKINTENGMVTKKFNVVK